MQRLGRRILARKYAAILVALYAGLFTRLILNIEMGWTALVVIVGVLIVVALPKMLYQRIVRAIFDSPNISQIREDRME